MRTSAHAVAALGILAAACGKDAGGPAPSPSASSVLPAVPEVSAKPPPNETAEQRAERLHKGAIIVDGHDDITSIILSTGFDLAKPNGKTHTDLPRMKSGGITGEFFSIYVDRVYAEKPTPLGGGSARRALDLIDVVYQQVERHPESLLLARSAEDIRRAKRENKVACLMGIEGGHAIENSLYALRDFYRLGVRYMTLTHTNNNDWADSAGWVGVQAAPHHGLTTFGEHVVAEMQRIGMLVDISHVSDETFDDVMRVAKAPVIASHSSARAICDSRRNLTDDELRALAKNGGVAMANFWPQFIDPAYKAAADAFFAKHGKEIMALRDKDRDDEDAFKTDLAKLHEKEPPMPKTPLSVLIDHIDHMVKVAGVDHVGLGSDFDGIDTLPEGMTGIGDLPKITLELVKRGYSDEDVLKILGGNFLRVLEAAEAYAASTKTSISGDGDTKTIQQVDGPGADATKDGGADASPTAR